MKIAKLGLVLKPNDIIDHVFWIDHQRYTLDRIEDKYLVWVTNCPECGNQFEATTPHIFDSINRRCKFHRRAGERVRDTQLSAQRDNADQPLP